MWLVTYPDIPLVKPVCIPPPLCASVIVCCGVQVTCAVCPVQSDSREVCRAMPLLLLLPSILLLCPVPLVSASCTSGQWQCSDSSCILREKVGGSSARSVCLFVFSPVSSPCWYWPPAGVWRPARLRWPQWRGGAVSASLWDCLSSLPLQLSQPTGVRLTGTVTFPHLIPHTWHTPYTLHTLHFTHFSGDRLQWPTGLQWQQWWAAASMWWRSRDQSATTTSSRQAVLGIHCVSLRLCDYHINYCL